MKKNLKTVLIIATFLPMSAFADIVMAVCTNSYKDGLQTRYTLLRNAEGNYRLLKESYGYNSNAESTRTVEFLHERLTCAIQPDFSFTCESIFTHIDYANLSSKFIMSKEENSQSYALEHSSSWREYRTGIRRDIASIDKGLICSKGSL